MKILKVNKKDFTVKVKLYTVEFNKIRLIYQLKFIKDRIWYIHQIKKGTFFNKYKLEKPENIYTIYFNKECVENISLESYINYFLNYVTKVNIINGIQDVEEINIIDRNLKLNKIRNLIKTN